MARTFAAADPRHEHHRTKACHASRRLPGLGQLLALRFKGGSRGQSHGTGRRGSGATGACCLGSRVWGRIPKQGRSHACCFSGNSARLHETKKLPSQSGGGQDGCGSGATWPTCECLKTIQNFPKKGTLRSLPQSCGANATKHSVRCKEQRPHEQT